MPDLKQLLHSSPCRDRWRWLLIALLCFVSYAALAPPAHAPTLGASDKLNHLLAFAALGVVSTLCWADSRWQGLAAAAGLLGYGALIEVAQAHTAGRHGEALDLVFDAIGIVAGVALATALRRRWPAPVG